jgi:hypothetical protein
VRSARTLAALGLPGRSARVHRTHGRQGLRAPDPLRPWPRPWCALSSMTQPGPTTRQHYRRHPTASIRPSTQAWPRAWPRLRRPAAPGPA